MSASGRKLALDSHPSRSPPEAAPLNGFRGIQAGAATFTSLESGILVGTSAVMNFSFTGVSFEAGVLGGSMISAIPNGSGGSVRARWLRASMISLAQNPMQPRWPVAGDVPDNSSSNPNRSRSYAVFAWIFTALWIAALIWTWVNYDQWPVWGRILAGAALVLTTPAGSDLFLLFRLARSRQQ